MSRNRNGASSGRDRNERFRAPGPSRNEGHGMPHSEDGRPRERERVDERQRPRRERKEEEDISNYEYVVQLNPVDWLIIFALLLNFLQLATINNWCMHLFFFRYGGGQVQSAEGGEEESGKEGASLDPNYAVSGKLTADTNTYRVNIIMCETIPFDFFLLLQGVVIKYNEPEEARIPKIRWRLYQFKGDETLRTFALVLFSVYVVFVLFIVISIAIATLYIHRQSAYLVGRERKVSSGHNVCVHFV